MVNDGVAHHQHLQVGQRGNHAVQVFCLPALFEAVQKSPGFRREHIKVPIEQVAGAEGELVGEHQGAAMRLDRVLLQLDVAGDIVAGLAVLAALAVDAGLHLVQQLDRRDGRVDGDLVHTGQGSQVFSAQPFAENRAAGAFVDVIVTGDCHHQHIALLAGALKVTNVTGVHQVKGAVAQDHTPTFGTPLARALGQGLNTGNFLVAHGLRPANAGARPSDR